MSDGEREEPKGLRRAPVQARAKERIGRILDAAEQMFVEVGYSGATTNQVANRAGTSIGSVYEFFRNKQALARGVADRYLNELAGLFTSGAGTTSDGGSVTISMMVDALHAFYTEHPALGPLLHGGHDSEDLQLLAEAFHTSVVAYVERIITDHRPGVDPARRVAVADMCAHVLLSVLDQATDKPEERQPALLAELKLLLTCYLAMALPPKPAR